MKKSRLIVLGVLLMLLITLYMNPRKISAQSGDEVYGNASTTEQLICIITGVCNEYADETGTESSQNPQNPNNPGGGSNPGKPGSPPAPNPTTPSGNDCPLRGGRIICGSINNPKGNPVNKCINEKLSITQCGHCNACYQSTNPNDYANFCVQNKCPNCGTEFGLDLAGQLGAPLYLPNIGGKQIDWTWIRTGKETIQGYSGTVSDDPTIRYWLQFHHTQPGSGIKSGKSGDRGGNICLSCFRQNQSAHVHIQLALGSTKPSQNGSTEANHWLDASIAFCN